ncbi:hypothetical protein ACXM5X_32330 [Pseudomonas saponiphila]
MNNSSPALSQADWKALYNDKAALIKSPEAHQFALDELAKALQAQGVIDASELADLVEQSKAAYQWGVEEQLTAELNQSDAT